MFDDSNIELDEKHSTGRGNQYLLRDDSGTIKLVMKVYRNPEIEALSFTFQPVCSIGLVPDFYVMLDRIEYMLEPNSMLSTINPKDLGVEAFLKQHEMFNAACESLDDALVENGDKETNYFPEMDKITENVIIIQSDETDIDKYYESLESLFAYFKSVSSFIDQAIEMNDKGLINAIAYNLGSGNLYLGDCLMDYIAEYNKTEGLQ